MARVKLSSFENNWYRPGRSRTVQALWYFLGLPLLRCSLNPFSCVRRHLLMTFGARIGRGAVIKPGVRVKYPWLFEAGENCWIGEDCWMDNLALVTLGDDVCISQGVYFCTGNHDWSDPSFRLIVKPISVRDGAWIGAKAVVGPDTVIGEGAVVATGAVATKDVPPYEIHAGNPARFVRRRELNNAATYHSSLVRS